MHRVRGSRSPGRRTIRLKGYDYARPGAYFITICTHRRQMLMAREAIARIARETWDELPSRFPAIALDEFVIMPNHVHFILWLQPPPG